MQQVGVQSMHSGGGGQDNGSPGYGAVCVLRYAMAAQVKH